MVNKLIMEIPVGRGWLARDKNGDLFWYELKPKFDNGIWRVSRVGSGNDLVCYGACGISYAAAKASLMRVGKKPKIELCLAAK